jgi:hypothetical protein
VEPDRPAGTEGRHRGYRPARAAGTAGADRGDRPQGQTGATGPQGPAGANGLSHAYTWDWTANGNNPEVAPTNNSYPGNYQNLPGGLSLPAGDYVINVTVMFQNSADFALQDNHRFISCYIAPGDGPGEENFLYINGEDTDSSDASMTMTSATAQGSSFTVTPGLHRPGRGYRPELRVPAV